MKYQASAYMRLKIDLKVDDALIGLIWSEQSWWKVLRVLCAEATSMPYLAFPLQLRSEPLKITVSPPDRWLLQLEDGKVGLWTKKYTQDAGWKTYFSAETTWVNVLSKNGKRNFNPDCVYKRLLDSSKKQNLITRTPTPPDTNHTHFVRNEVQQHYGALQYIIRTK